MATNKRMDNGGYGPGVEEGTELGSVNSAIAGSSKKEPSKLVCRTEICRSAKRTYLPPNLTSSPWNKFKAVSFLVLIVLFIIWIVVYSVLRHLEVV